MEQLSPLDAAFLEIEDEDPHAALSIASVAVLEGPAPDQRDFVAAFTARLPMIPHSRQKIRHIPFDLGPPVWVDDAHFDAARHVKRIAAPAPGGETDLCALVSMIMAERLDRNRPLWECWVIEGLAEGRWAILSKVHHCLADGVSGNALHERVFTRAPPAIGRTSDVTAEPGTVELVLNAVRGFATSPLDELAALVRNLFPPTRLARRVTDTAHGLGAVAAALIPVARSSLSGPIGTQRRYELAHVSLPEVREIARTFQVTINDVVLAAITGAFRDLLLRRGEHPTAKTLRTLVPVSVRTEHDNTVDNRISLLLPLLPVDVADPVRRLAAVHRRLTALKNGHEAEAGPAMTASAGHVPFAPIAWGVRAAARLPQHVIVTVATNIPGPRHLLSMLGRDIIELYPYVPIALRLRTGVAVLTYRDRMTFGITADLDSAPETPFLADAIENDIAALATSARNPNGPHSKDLRPLADENSSGKRSGHGTKSTVDDGTRPRPGRQHHTRTGSA